MKGLAPQQIALLVLAILVLAVVAYLLYRTFISGSSQLSAEECRAEATRLCTACKLSNLESTTWPTCDNGNFDDVKSDGTPGRCIDSRAKLGMSSGGGAGSTGGLWINTGNCKKFGIS